MRRTFDRERGCTREWFTPDWTELTDRTHGLVNYGHIAEAAWFTSVVGALAADQTILDFGRSLLGFVLREGWDARDGGIYSYGRAGGLPVDTRKVWWMQAELLGALSHAYRLTHDVLYLDWLRRHTDFVVRRQRDSAVGEWHATVYADGTIQDGRKGSPSKAAYHVVQGLHHAAANLAAAASVERSEGEATVVGWEDLAL